MEYTIALACEEDAVQVDVELTDAEKALLDKLAAKFADAARYTICAPRLIIG